MRMLPSLAGTAIAAAAFLPHAAAQMLLPNSPDPFCPAVDGHTEIVVQLPAAGHVQLEIRDVFDQDVRFLVGQVLAAGYHAVWWDGLNGAGDTVGTGNFTIRLDFEGQVETEPCAIFCGADLEGPYRQHVWGLDQAAAFAIGLEQPEIVALVFLADDHTTVVRTIECGQLPAGASTIVWDLRDDGGDLVPNGVYVGRLAVPGYLEEIEFPLLTSAEPVTISWTARDCRDHVWAGGPDSLTAVPIETPMLEAWAHLSRPLHEAELRAMQESWQTLGSFAMISPETMMMSSDSTLLHFTSFSPRQGRSWPDVWGVGRVHVPLPWFQNENEFMRLRHEFSDITMTDPLCNLIGNVDPLDWDCESGGLMVEPPCPNPVSLGDTLAIAFQVPASDLVDLGIVDRGGFLVRALLHGQLPPGMHMILWDLTDDAGVPVSEDIYRLIGVRGEDQVCAGDIVVGEVAGVAQPPERAGGSDGGSAADGAGGAERAGAASQPGEPGMLLTASPNPFHVGGTTSIVGTVTHPGLLPIEIYDLAGRRLRSLGSETLPGSGVLRATWDGRDAGGKLVPSGVYLARPAGAARGGGTAVVLIR